MFTVSPGRKPSQKSQKFGFSLLMIWVKSYSWVTVRVTRRLTDNCALFNVSAVQSVVNNYTNICIGYQLSRLRTEIAARLEITYQAFTQRRQSEFKVKMAEGRFNFMIASLLLLSALASVKSAPTANNSVSSADRKKIFITASQMDVVISSNQETKLILQKLETLSAENKQLAQKFQSLEKRLSALEGRGTSPLNILHHSHCQFLGSSVCDALTALATAGSVKLVFYILESFLKARSCYILIN